MPDLGIQEAKGEGHSNGGCTSFEMGFLLWEMVYLHAGVLAAQQ